MYQVTAADKPVLGQNLPTGQTVAIDDDAGQKEPTGHGFEVEAPVPAGQRYPAGQPPDGADKPELPQYELASHITGAEEPDGQ